MKTTETNLLDWQKRYGTEEACAQALARQRWHAVSLHQPAPDQVVLGDLLGCLGQGGISAMRLSQQIGVSWIVKTDEGTIACYERKLPN